MVLNAVQSLKESATITEHMKLKFRTFITGLTVSVALFAGAPSAASAQDCTVPSPTQDQYCPPSTTIEQGSVDPSDPSDPSAPSDASAPSGGLPFTGYDMGFAALAAVALIGAGFGLRRAARTDV